MERAIPRQEHPHKHNSEQNRILSLIVSRMYWGRTIKEDHSFFKTYITLINKLLARQEFNFDIGTKSGDFTLPYIYLVLHEIGYSKMP